jgi:hypothetical protein
VAHLYQLKNFDRDEETALVNELEVRLMEWNALPAVVNLYLQLALVNAMDPGQGQFDAKVLWLNEKDDVFEANPKPVKGNYVTTCNSESHKMISEYEKKLEKQTKDSDTALGYFKTSLGIKLSTLLKHHWQNPALTSYRKARASMDLVRQYMTTSPELVLVGIDNDFAKLSSSEVFIATLPESLSRSSHDSSTFRSKRNAIAFTFTLSLLIFIFIFEFVFVFFASIIAPELESTFEFSAIAF